MRSGCADESTLSKGDRSVYELPHKRISVAISLLTIQLPGTPLPLDRASFRALIRDIKLYSKMFLFSFLFVI